MNKASIKEEKKQLRRRHIHGDLTTAEMNAALAALIIEQLSNYEVTAVEAANMLQRIK